MLKVQEKNRFGEKVFQLEGELIRENSSDFEKNILRMAENCKGKVTLDMWGVDFVDSIGIGALLRVAGALEKSGQMLVLGRPNTSVKRIFDTIKLPSKLKVVNQV